ncbi:SWI/SNF and RSC complexes subunit ssr3 [Golovinomyces cichoracearum]|uniref:SWI/SNF and RSC complexes subunit ssr3 n=1 Tax=Golovinomyces cichoracearum TaxID=62708 RepID=A0A420HBG1_9PEZI|nr:SWI/SNF and RSC complexes subunit ssr3 [Golovinomyces cichoracearum]
MQPNYRSLNQPPAQRSPHAAAVARRGMSGGMIPGVHSQATLTPAQVQAQQAAQIQANDRARLRSRKPIDKNLPEGVEDIIIGDGAQNYRKLRDTERRLDSIITRKRLDIQDSVNRNVKCFRTLRIWISNTVEDQPWQADSLDIDTFDFSTNIDSSYRVKIEGKLLDDEDDDMNNNNSDWEDDLKDVDPMTGEKVSKRKLPRANYKFSSFFKAVTVDFDQQGLKDKADHTVEWKKPPQSQNIPGMHSATDFDQLEFKRAGDENTNITINLFRDETPERFLLQPTLADILDTEIATRAETLMGIWDYVKLMGLQEDDEKKSFDCDHRLKLLLQREKGYIPYLTDSINQHLVPLPPIKLPYTIRVDRQFHENPLPTIYDVRVQVDDPLRAAFASYLTNQTYAQNLREITVLNDHLAIIIQKISSSKSKHKFLDELANDPTNFISRWFSSQKRDLEIISGETTRGVSDDTSGDEWRKGGQDGIWASDNVRESVSLMVSQRAKV